MTTTYYVVYRGDDPICVGEKAEVAEKLGISESSVYWLSTPAARKRADKPGSTKMYAERVEVEE